MNAIRLNTVTLKHIFKGYYVVVHLEDQTFSCVIPRDEISKFFIKLHDEFGDLAVNVLEEDLS